MPNLAEGKHKIEIEFSAKPFGKLTLKVEDGITAHEENVLHLPRNNEDDYSEDIIRERQKFVENYTGVKLQHISKYSFDPHIAHGNVEHFTGVAQVPIGFAGPIRIDGEHAKGEFMIPLATAEGTLVASYNRGMKIINLCGGVKCTVSRDVMQRAPVFVFEDARGAREFVEWCKQHKAEIAREAEATTNVGKLQYVDPYLASKFAFFASQYRMQQSAFVLQYPMATTTIICVSGRAAGRLMIDRSGPRVVVVDVSLLPEFRGLRIGTQLLREVQSEARAASREVVLHVIVGNPARRLYERMGFVVTGTHGQHLEMAWTATLDVVGVAP